MKTLKLNRLIKKLFVTKWVFALFIILFAVHIATRFSFLETKSKFGFDQVDNAWAAKNIIVDLKFPLAGMQAKGNTGFYIGPYYYYYISLFYLLTDLDPIASPIIAGVTSVITFLLLFFIIKNIFDAKVAIVALFINTFSIYIIYEDRTQWPVNFIVPISLLIFYSLYKIVSGNYKFILLLVFALGFSLHIHFTSIFYIPLVLVCLPFFPRKKQTVMYAIYSIPIALIFIAPIVLAMVNGSDLRAASYISTTFLGVHLVRILQVARDGFIQFESIINVSFLKFAGFILTPIYIVLFLREKEKRRAYIIVALSVLWILVPWFAFSTYRGEISDYYFSMTRPIVIIILSYLIYRIIILRNYIFYAVLSCISLWYIVTNLSAFGTKDHISLATEKRAVMDKIRVSDYIPFSQGDPNSYLYYVYKQRFEK